MVEHISFDFSKSQSFIDEKEMNRMQQSITKSHDLLHRKTGAGSAFTGWVDWPVNYDHDEFLHVKQAARKIVSQSDAFVVIGVGGSYIGARAALEMLTHPFYNQLPGNKRETPEIYFAGHHLSASYLHHLFEILDNKEISVNVISKSGTTLEPAIAFRLIQGLMEKKYGKKGMKDRIFITTDEKKGALKRLADEEGYETFVIPDDIGGRYSVLTAVGLLPMAVAGVDIDEVMSGAKAGYHLYLQDSLDQNPCYQYAAARNVLYGKGKIIELFVHYDPRLQYFSEWWKQLFAESEGKDEKGIFPASANFTTDLHSLGQYIQQGRRDLFETIIQIKDITKDMIISPVRENPDDFGFLAGKSLNDINRQAMEGTIFAHTDGGVPNLLIQIPQLSPYYFGQMVYFFEKACAISGYLLGVNPFDQPGVEEYKRNMFALLGKPGYEERKEALLKRVMKT